MKLRENQGRIWFPHTLGRDIIMGVPVPLKNRNERAGALARHVANLGLIPASHIPKSARIIPE